MILDQSLLLCLGGQLAKLMVSLTASWQYPNSNYSFDVLFCLNVGCCWKIKVTATAITVVYYTSDTHTVRHWSNSVINCAVTGFHDLLKLSLSFSLIKLSDVVMSRWSRSCQWWWRSCWFSSTARRASSRRASSSTGTASARASSLTCSRTSCARCAGMHEARGWLSTGHLLHRSTEETSHATLLRRPQGPGNSTTERLHGRADKALTNHSEVPGSIPSTECMKMNSGSWIICTWYFCFSGKPHVYHYFNTLPPHSL